MKRPRAWVSMTQERLNMLRPQFCPQSKLAHYLFFRTIDFRF
jgi:hypothetical protein